MDEVQARFNEIYGKFEKSNISTSDLGKLGIFRKSPWKNVLVALLVLVGAIFLLKHQLVSENCIFPMKDASKLFRSPEYCDMCENLDKIDKINQIHPETFIDNYVKPCHPVVVTDGIQNWPAKTLFNFKFFQKTFTENIQMEPRKNCQFFPYKTDFESLQEVFNMSDARASLKVGEKPWYVGWNNCDDEAGRYLKQFYGRPYFLPNTTESLALSWIFMGGPGFGAQMHVDNVHYASWQAQLSGRKLWKLAPPPECYYKCNFLEIVVEPGEIIALDTNRWYHQTVILPGEISITIGSEFD